MKSTSVYIHIPFCNSICHYCDFCKVYYQEEWADKYLEALKQEIKNNYNNEIVKTLYIGGGTPSSLNLKELDYLLNICQIFKRDKKIEYTIEMNVQDINEEKLNILKNYGINRISIGIESSNEKYLKILNRPYTKKMIEENIFLVKKYFTNISIDLMYGFNGQEMRELIDDVKFFLKLSVPHISTYSLIIEPNTVLYNQNYQNVDEDLEADMYEYIVKTLNKNGYIHYEISNFGKENYFSNHNLTYWNNEHYYGFGLGSHGYINDIRYANTRNLNKYIAGKYRLQSHKLLKKEQMENELILGLRKIDGVNLKNFCDKYHQDIEKTFNIDKYLQNKELLITDGNLKINPKYLYVSNSILECFLTEE